MNRLEAKMYNDIGLEAKMYNDIGRIATALETIAKAVENQAHPLYVVMGSPDDRQYSVVPGPRT